MPFEVLNFRPSIALVLESPNLPAFGFRAWLGSKSEREVVGYRFRPYCCTISSWVSSLGYERPATYGKTVSVRDIRLKNGLRQKFDLPQWAQAFERLHDAPYRSEFKNRYCGGEAVTAYQALKLLDRALGKMNSGNHGKK